MALSSFEGNRRVRPLLAALLATLTISAYLPVLGNGFVAFDDPLYVTGNPHVLAGITREGLRWSLAANEGGNWHPLTWWSHMLDVQLFGRWAGGHHLTSALIHAGAAAALFLVLAAMTGAFGPSLVVAALFALHPLHVESVAWVSERKDVLSGLLWLAALAAYLAYARRPARARYALALALFAAALMAKPMAVTLPFVLLALDHWPLGRGRTVAGRSAAALLREKAPFLLLAAAAAALAVHTQIGAHALEPVADAPRVFLAWLAGLRLLNAANSLATYLGQTLWPSGLAVFYPHPAHFLGWLRSGVALLVVAGISFLAVRARRGAPWLVTGWLWYLVTLSPVIGVVQVGAQGRADRYTYLSLVGIFLMAAWSVREAVRRHPPLLLAAAFLACFALAAGAAVTVRQVGYWRDSATLFRHALEVTRDNDLAHRVLGDLAQAEGRFTEAEAHYRAFVALSPRTAAAHTRLGLALSRQGRREEAVAEYRAAVRLAPGDAEARNNLGVDLTALGRPAEAEAELRAAVRLDPGRAEVRVNLGDALAAQGSVGEAEAEYRAALALRPDFTEAQARLERLVKFAGEAAR